MQNSISIPHYKIIRTHVQTEEYLNIDMNWNLVKLKIQLRSLYPRLSIGNKTVNLECMNKFYGKSGSICKICQLEDEDLFHFICKCPQYNYIRMLLNKKLPNKLPSIKEEFLDYVKECDVENLIQINHFLLQAKTIRDIRLEE
jgi:hypothetical protein